MPATRVSPQHSGEGQHGRIRRWAPLAGLVLLLALAVLLGLPRYVSLEALRDNRAALGEFVAARPVAAPLAFIALEVAVDAASLPIAVILSLAAGLLFGTLLG